MHKIAGITIFIVLVLVVAPSAAQDYYVQSNQAPLWRSPSFAAEKMVLIPQGESVNVHEERKGWFLVSYKEQTGWMLKLMLSKQTPAATGALNEDAMRTLDERSRMRPSAFASTAAARGLMNKEDGFGNQLKLNFEAVEVMESYRVSEKEARAFLAEGQKE